MIFNITLKELQRATRYAEEYGVSEHKTITMLVEHTGGLGPTIKVRPDHLTEPHDITDSEAW